ncbi:alpha/beta hydrolase [Tunicatimonas pelagia]|uniref:alpha/beta hydrolase n=1 Tax=Tunicatimonas pelagia TaxID=931531 RepID=UPI002664F576|nr:alpha/beta hydrolase [Tunicatimonas pelagia]WKN42366.1 alpha/beta hydrolase [Tunicatimonas pelagia]
MILITQVGLSQTKETNATAEEQYVEGLKAFSPSVSDFIYSDFSAFNSVSPEQFVSTLDSLEDKFEKHLAGYSDRLSPEVVKDEQVSIAYYFDRLLLEYPAHHYTYTGKQIHLSKDIQNRLARHHTDFNDTSLLSNEDYRSYVQAFLEQQKRAELEKSKYDSLDNRWLNATWTLIDQWFENPLVNEYWKQEYLANHIRDIGIKNVEPIYQEFIRTSESSDYQDKIARLYNEHQKNRGSHRIETYKTVDGYDLDIHLFMPDTTTFKASAPTMVCFHGGSWTEGKPDYFFWAGDHYTQQGWAVAVVEYRIAARHGTLPFASVKDARSAIRWLRENAKRLNIDISKIVATGNSSGGHLSLATALADDCNETSDNVEISPVPNALIVIAGVYDLTVENAQWISRAAEDEQMVTDISPNHLMKKELPPTLIIHGSQDNNCPYPTAQYFATEMKALGNTIDFHAIEGAGHFIWFGEHSGEVGQIRQQYLEALTFD